MFEQLAGSPSGSSRRAPGEQSRQLDVLLSRELVHEVVRLEDEPDVAPPDLGEAPFTQPVDPPPFQPQLAGARSVEAAQQMKQRRLSAAARPHHGQRLATGDVEVHLVHCPDETLSTAVPLAKSTGAHGHHLGLDHRSLLRSVQASFARLQPAKIRLEAKHDPFEQQSRIRAVGSAIAAR